MASYSHWTAMLSTVFLFLYIKDCFIYFFCLFTASELAKTPRKNVSFSLKNDPEIMINIPQCSKGHSASDKVQLKNSDKSEFLSTAPSGLRKRLIVPRSHSDSESEYSASNSEDDDGVAQEYEEDTNEVILSQKIPSQNRALSAPICKETPSKKMKRDKTVSGVFNLKEKLYNILKLSYPKRRDSDGRST